MTLDWSGIRTQAIRISRWVWHHLRHPTWRSAAIMGLGMLGLLALYVLALIPLTPSATDIKKARISQPTLILYADGKEMAQITRENREWTPLSEMSPHLVKALVATEDHRFREHGGIDWRRLASSVWHTASGDRQGGSTITQQLARNLYPEEIGRAPTLNRKLKEAITALKIESLYSKDEILETYLNTVPFLYHAFGIEMAAQTYFDKSAKQLNVVESATLIGMLKGTSYYNPVRNPERSLQRRNIVLSQMVKRGELSQTEFEKLKKLPLRVDFERQTEAPGEAPHFRQQLRQWLIDWADRNDYDIYADGLVVHTTLDSRLQNWATKAVERQGKSLQSIADAAWRPTSVWSPEQSLVRHFIRESKAFRTAVEQGQSEEDAFAALSQDASFMRELKADKTQIQAGFVAMDPQSGAIRAWVGSRDFEQDQFDHVRQARRQPGSTFKPFVYAAAFSQGAKPTDTLPDQPLEIKLEGGGTWRPTDGKPPSGKDLTLRTGLVYSKNIITAQLMQQVGPDKVAALARKMGVNESPLEEVLALSLGTSPVSLYEMVNAYGTMANGGRHIEPQFVTRIENRRGELLEAFEVDKGARAIKASANDMLLDVMRGVVDQGTGAAIRQRYGLRGDLAGKTGTSQNNADGWFLLMHARLVGGAWVGFNDSRVTLRSDHWGRGSQSALPIVADVFKQAIQQGLLDTQIKLGRHAPQDLPRQPSPKGNAAISPLPTIAASDADGSADSPADATAALPAASSPVVNSADATASDVPLVSPQTSAATPAATLVTPPTIDTPAIEQPASAPE